jgi:hypothetical protein
MAKTTTPLRDSQIRGAKPDDGKTEKVLYDGDGLQIHIKSNGSKLWNFRYYHPVTKKRQIIALGAYPALPISSAREQRAKALSLLALELDPKFEREKELKVKAREHSNTFAKIADEFISNIKSKKVSAKQAKAIRDSLVLHVYPFLGHKPINQLEAFDFIEALKPMSNKGILEQLNRVCQRINEVMDYAANH